jgi:hypothetical protein
MVMEEIYILTKHANFSSNYVENIPVYKRRYYLELLKTEMEETKKHQEREMRKSRNSHK